MIWFILSILTALSESMKGVFGKKSLKSIDEYIVAWSLRLFSLPFLVPLLFFIEIPPLGIHFWTALFFAVIIVVVTSILYMRAIKHSDLSLVMPVVAFTPLFLLITSPLINGEFPTFFGLVGVLLIVVGSYALNIKEKQNGYAAPFRSLLKSSGPKLMLIVAFIWSIGANIDKIGVQNSSPIFWAISVNVLAALVMIPIVLHKSPHNIRQMPANAKTLIPIGLFSALMLVFQMTAINMTLVAYVISIKRTSAIFSVFFGYLIFREKDIRSRLVGTVIMIIGVLLITLS
jgi:drug/metabolite transporter (DMT)-like permease